MNLNREERAHKRQKRDQNKPGEYGEVAANGQSADRNHEWTTPFKRWMGYEK